MSAIEFREPTAEDTAAFFHPTITAFGMHPDEERIASWAPFFRTGLSIGALEAGAWVGGASALVDRLVLPGGATLPAALVTMVGVLPTHRRRGVLRGLMERQLAAAAAKDLPVAVLIASESVIYGRFGYGPATWTTHVTIDTPHAGFVESPAAPGAVRLVPKADALELLHAAYERCLAGSPGELGRSKGFWREILRDRKEDRRGSSELFVALHEDPTGAPDGAATYRMKVDFDPRNNLADGTLDVIDLFGATPEIEAALWRTLLDVDLVKQVRARSRPVDDTLRWRLVEPRRLRTEGVTDWLWVRVLNVPRVLAARSYAVAGHLVLQVADAFRPEQSGRYALHAEPAGATCERTDADPDLHLPVATLGSLLLGGVAPSRLAAAGRLQARDEATLQRADALFHTHRAPHCTTDF